MLKTEACVGVKWIDGEPCFISIYVDDLILYAPNLRIIAEFKQVFKSRFKMKDLGPITTFSDGRFSVTAVKGSSRSRSTSI
jgi:hypothetical protein